MCLYSLMKKVRVLIGKLQSKKLAKKGRQVFKNDFTKSTLETDEEVSTRY